MSRNRGTPRPVREGEGLPHGEETAVSGFESRLVHMASATDDGSVRRCTTCGQSVEDLPYEFWLFHTCRACAADATPKRWGDTGTARKWRYFPHWHMVDHPERDPHWRTAQLSDR